MPIQIDINANTKGLDKLNEKLRVTSSELLAMAKNEKALGNVAESKKFYAMAKQLGQAEVKAKALSQALGTTKKKLESFSSLPKFSSPFSVISSDLSNLKSQTTAARAQIIAAGKSMQTALSDTSALRKYTDVKAGESLTSDINAAITRAGVLKAELAKATGVAPMGMKPLLTDLKLAEAEASKLNSRLKSLTAARAALAQGASQALINSEGRIASARAKFKPGHYMSQINNEEKLAVARDKAAQGTTKSVKGLKNLQVAMGGVARSMGAMATSYSSLIPLMAGLAVGAATLQMYKLGEALEYTTTYVDALDEGLGKGLSTGNISSQILDMRDLRTGPNELALGLKELAKAGDESSASMKQLAELSKFATLAEIDLAAATTLVIGQTKAFGTTYSGAANIISAAATNSATTIEKLATALSYTTELAEVSKYNFNEIATAIAVLANKGVESSKAGTAIRTSLIRLQTPTGKLTKMMEELGVTFSAFTKQGEVKGVETVFRELEQITDSLGNKERAAFEKELFGMRAMKGGANLIKSMSEEWEKIYVKTLISGEGVTFVSKKYKELATTAKAAREEMVSATQNAAGQSYIEADSAESMKRFYQATEEFMNGPASKAVMTWWQEFTNLFVDGGTAVVSTINKITEAHTKWGETLNEDYVKDTSAAGLFERYGIEQAIEGSSFWKFLDKYIDSETEAKSNISELKKEAQDNVTTFEAIISAQDDKIAKAIEDRREVFPEVKRQQEALANLKVAEVELGIAIKGDSPEAQARLEEAIKSRDELLEKLSGAETYAQKQVLAIELELDLQLYKLEAEGATWSEIDNMISEQNKVLAEKKLELKLQLDTEAALPELEKELRTVADDVSRKFYEETAKQDFSQALAEVSDWEKVVLQSEQTAKAWGITNRLKETSELVKELAKEIQATKLAEGLAALDIGQDKFQLDKLIGELKEVDKLGYKVFSNLQAEYAKGASAYVKELKKMGLAREDFEGKTQLNAQGAEYFKSWLEGSRMFENALGDLSDKLQGLKYEMSDIKFDFRSDNFDEQLKLAQGQSADIDPDAENYKYQLKQVKELRAEASAASSENEAGRARQLALLEKAYDITKAMNTVRNTDALKQEVQFATEKYNRYKDTYGSMKAQAALELTLAKNRLAAAEAGKVDVNLQKTKLAQMQSIEKEILKQKEAEKAAAEAEQTRVKDWQATIANSLKTISESTGGFKTLADGFMDGFKSLDGSTLDTLRAKATSAFVQLKDGTFTAISAADDYTQAIDLTGDAWKTSADVATESINRTTSAIDDLLSTAKKFNLSVSGIDGARAKGGPVSAGGTYLVGEDGAEIFTPSKSGYVIPNHQLNQTIQSNPNSRAQSSSSGSSKGLLGTYNINLSMDGENIQVQADRDNLAKFQRTEARNQRFASS